MRYALGVPTPDKTQSIPRVKRINRAILDEERRLRDALPWLRHQDTLCLLIYGASVALISGAAAGYLTGVLPWWAALVLVTLALSMLHELEHDLIHALYFQKQPWAQDLLFAGIFLAKMSMDPWTRRKIHLRHHRVSGQAVDVEERLIGLGMPMGPRRLLLTIVPAFTVLVWPDIYRALRAEKGTHPDRASVWQRLARLLSAGFALLPFVVVPAAVAGSPVAVAALVLYVGPNTLRHASIAFVSSSSHYYGDIPDNAVYYQNQILDHWLLLPLQAFCFNFGATHVLHHYVVRQPFYIRQLVAPGVLPVLLEEGVRRNDLGTFRRANRWGG